MKKKLSVKHVGMFTIILAAFAMTLPVAAQAADQLQVESAAICENVVDREAVEAGTRFQATVGRLYCFTKIVGAENPAEINHVWYFGNNERARVSLSVKANNWRTYSSKLIQAHEVGDWRVEVLDSAGNILETVSFEVIN